MRIRIHVSIQESDAVPVAHALVRMETLRLIETEDEGTEKWRQLADTLAHQDDRFAKVCDALGIEPERGGPSDSLDPEKDAEEARLLLDEIDRKLDRWRKTRRESAKKAGRFQHLAENLECLQSAGVDYPEIGEFRYLELRFGWIPSDQKDRMTCPALRNPLMIIPLLERKEKLLVGAATIHSNGHLLQRVLDSLFFEPVEMDAATSKEEMDKRLKDMERRLERSDRERYRFAQEWRGRIISLWDRIEKDSKAVRLIGRYGRFEEAGYCHLTGDIPDEKRDRLFQLIQKTATRPHAIFAGKPVAKGN